MGIPLWRHRAKDRKQRTVAFDTPWLRDEPSRRFAHRRRTLLRRQNAFRLQPGRAGYPVLLERERRRRQSARDAVQAPQLVGRSIPSAADETDHEPIHPYSVRQILSSDREADPTRDPRGPRHFGYENNYQREEQAMERMQRVLQALWRPNLEQIPFNMRTILDVRETVPDSPNEPESPV